MHGCFWHAHLDCPRARVPVSNGRFWEMKFAANRARDAAAIRALRGRGFRVAVVWECELTRLPLVRRRLRRLLPDT